MRKGTINFGKILGKIVLLFDLAFNNLLSIKILQQFYSYIQQGRSYPMNIGVAEMGIDA